MESVSPVDSTYLHTLHGCSYIYIYIYNRILLYLANYVLLVVATRLSNGPLPVVARFQRWANLQINLLGLSSRVSLVRQTDEIHFAIWSMGRHGIVRSHLMIAMCR